MLLRDKSTIFLIILALILVAGGVWYTQKPAPATPPVVSGNGEQVVDKTANELTSGEIDTSDWKTYRNDKVGFTMKYPNDWTTDNDDFYTTEMYDWLKSINFATEGSPLVGINFTTTIIEPKTDDQKVVISKKLIVDGVMGTSYNEKAIKESEYTFVGQEYDSVILPIKNDYLRITLYFPIYPIITGKNYRNIFNTMLSSIHFY